MNGHTKGPWKVWNDRIWTDEPSDEMREICSISGNRGDRDDNAAFIVRACNAHDELLAHLKRMIEYYDSGEIRAEAAAKIRDARAAIAAAERYD